MSYTGTSNSCSRLRSNIRFQLLFMILPGVILVILAAVLLNGCAAHRDESGGSTSGCSSEEKAQCICTDPSVVTLGVEGMGCVNCAKELQEVLASVPGVKAAKVCFEDKKAFVTLDKDHPATMEAIQAAVAKRQEEHSKLESDPNCVKPKS